MKQMKNMTDMTPKASRGILFWVLLFIIIAILYQQMSKISEGKPLDLKFSDFMTKVEGGQIKSASIVSNVVTGELQSIDPNGKPYKYKTAMPTDYPDFIKILRTHSVMIEVEELNKNEWYSLILTWILPLGIMIVFWVVIMRQQGGGRAFSFGKSRARMFTGEREKTTFKDVAGIDEAKEELEEIIEFLRDPKKFQRLGGRIPKGVLLVGPPGTGKTLLARAIAGEAKVPFFSISGSDFVELFVGVGASRVRDLFEEGKKHSPCLIFIDEIDAVGRQRGAGMGGGHDEREQTLNALLVEMDGFAPNVGIIVIAATNRPDILDTALLRPGRFDRNIVVPVPDVKGREEIFKVHTAKAPLSKSVDLKVLSRSTPGFTGADIANMVNEAALYASRKEKKKIEMEDFEYAKDKVLMGAERRSMIISDSEKLNTAYHEAGHALVAVLEKEADPIHKVSIIPRGMALGVTQQLPLDDKHTYSQAFLEARLSVLMAGRVSEEIFLDTITTGASNDLDRATLTARQMVCDWGMSSLGPIRLSQKDDLFFLGRDMTRHSEFSNETARKIDDEISRILHEAYERAKTLISENKEPLAKIANYLLERESLTAKELEEILAGRDLPPVNGNEAEEKAAQRKKEDEEEDVVVEITSKSKKQDKINPDEVEDKP